MNYGDEYSFVSGIKSRFQEVFSYLVLIGLVAMPFYLCDSCINKKVANVAQQPPSKSRVLSKKQKLEKCLENPPAILPGSSHPSVCYDVYGEK